jgi:hypothetical protein
MASFDYASDMLGGASPNVQPTAAPQGRDYAADVLGSGDAAPAQVQPKPDAPKGNWITRGYNAIVGAQDPKYKDAKAFDRTDAATGGVGASMALSMLGGSDDKSLGDVIQQSLGDKFVRRHKDANGYELIEHTATPDGKPTIHYVNKPGLDMSDVGRGVFGAVPYVMGGAGIAAVTKGAPIT